MTDTNIYMTMGPAYVLFRARVPVVGDILKGDEELELCDESVQTDIKKTGGSECSIPSVPIKSCKFHARSSRGVLNILLHWFSQGRIFTDLKVKRKVNLVITNDCYSELPSNGIAFDVGKECSRTAEIKI